MRLLDRLLVLPQHLLPQRALSAAVKRLTRAEGALVPYAIRAFCTAYGVDLSEAQDGLDSYRSFNQFFTRALRAEAILDRASSTSASGTSASSRDWASFAPAS